MWLIATWVMAGFQPGGGEPTEVPAQREAERQLDEAKSEASEVPVRIFIRDRMGDRFRLVQARVVVDDRTVVHATAGAGQDLERDFKAPAVVLPPGEHALTATLVYQQKNRGPFSYLDNYRYQVQRVYPFTLERAAKPADVVLVARELEGLNLPPEKKLVLDATSPAGSGVRPLPRADGANDEDSVTDR